MADKLSAIRRLGCPEYLTVAKTTDANYELNRSLFEIEGGADSLYNLLRFAFWNTFPDLIW